MLLSVADVALEAAAKGKPSKLRIVAYTGGVMRVAGYGDVVIDLAGLELPEKLVVLGDHDAALSAVIGPGVPSSDGRQLTVIVTLAENDAAAQVMALLAAGTPLQASVGVSPIEKKETRGGELKVNGQTIQLSNLVTLVSKGVLKEVSILPLGADTATDVSIAAGRNGANTMPVEMTATLERERVKAIIDLTEGFPEIRAKAIDEGWTNDRTELETLRVKAQRHEVESIRAARPVINSTRSGSAGSGASPREVLAAAVLIHAGGSAIAEKQIGARATQAAADLRCHSLIDICAASLRLAGRDVPIDRTEMIRAAFSTASLPVALGDSANKMALDAYRELKPTWRGFSRIVNARDFKSSRMIRLTMGGGFEKVGKGGELKHGTLSEQTFEVTLDTQGKMFGLTRQDVINDDLGLFNDMSKSLGRMGARAISDEVYTVLLKNKEPDGSTSFFTEARDNYAVGTGTALSFSSFGDARRMLAQQVDHDGQPIDVMARSMLAPPELEVTARQLLLSEFVQRDVSEDALPTGNPFRNSLEGGLLVEPRLSNSKYTGYSATAWYLFSAPQDGPVAVAFLDGKDGPVVEMADAPFNTLGVQFRGFIDFGASLADYRAVVKMKGAA